MRTPTDRADAWTTWREWLAGRVPAQRDGAPICGLYRARIRKRIVPLMIDIEPGETDEAGDLLADEQFVCELDGAPADAFEAWGMRVAPISQTEFDTLEKTRRVTRGVTDLSKDIII